MSQDNDIGGLEEVPIEEIREARAHSLRRVNNATSSILAARRDLLAAGYGVDHPICKNLDRLAILCEGVFMQIRGTP